MKKLVGLSLIAFLLIFGCSKRPHPDVSKIQLDVKIQPFFKELHAIAYDSLTYALPGLEVKYGSFLDSYSQKIIHVGSPKDSNYITQLISFLDYKATKETYQECKVRYKDISGYEAQLTDAYKCYQYYFPKNRLPQVYFHISGYNQSVVVDSGYISVSVEKYLGADCKFYEWLGIQKYLRSAMVPEKIVPDVMKAIALTEFTYNDSIDNLLNQMVYYGRSVYFLGRVMPDIQDTILFDYTSKQLDWCQENESKMWATLIENKHLFSSDGRIINKYLGESPFTSFFGSNSSPRTGIYLGYKIVEAYMDRNPEVTLDQLMHQNNAQKILALSAYRP